MNNTRLTAVTFFLSALVFIAHAGPSYTRPPAPSFSIESGNGEIVTDKSVRGKIVVMFYEKREITRKNADMKDRLNEMFDRQPENIRQAIVRLPVIDCSGVFWPVTEIWKKGLRDNSKRVGMTVYCDWSGNVSRNFGMVSDESNMVILDGKNTIRYRFSGRLDQNRLEEIIDTLHYLVYEKN
jgi:alkyl hydroperoxide reductase subunit AhpC